ncbi:hypothetical protein WA538_005496 [Blastocystis sp. DL]
MVRKKLREKSGKQKAPIQQAPSIVPPTTKLSRGQRKRLVNKMHVLSKKGKGFLSDLDKENVAKRLQAEIEAFSVERDKDTQKKSKKKQARGAPKSQQKQNEMLFVEMQRYRNVVLNEDVKEDPYEAVRQYLQNQKGSA